MVYCIDQESTSTAIDANSIVQSIYNLVLCIFIGYGGVVCFDSVIKAKNDAVIALTDP